ncbi:MAG: hypothetical protein SGBAC_003328 [Bacillariaceae sp.]
MARSKAKCCFFALAIALFFCIKAWITGMSDLIDSNGMKSEWIKVDALIVGRNVTILQDDTVYFCARVEFTSQSGENVTATSQKKCVSDAFTIVIGSYVPILYDGANPEEFIEQDILESDLIWAKIMMGVGIPGSIILINFLYRMILNHRQRRRRPPPFDYDIEDSMELYRYSQNDSEGTPVAPAESPEQRKEKILSKLHAVTVLGDSSSTLASSIQSRSKLESSGKAREATGGTEAVHGNREEPKVTDADENYRSENNQGDLTNSESQHQASSTMSFLSSLIRPNHDAECSICLDHYQQGEIICTPKKDECNHVFHRECLMEWMMMNNDGCPLCRVDFMKDDDDLEV